MRFAIWAASIILDGMNKIIEIGQPPIAIELRINARAKRYSLRISPHNQRPTLTLPKRHVMSDAIEFAHTQEPWLRKHLSKRPERLTLGFGGRIHIDGIEREIVSGQGRRVIVDDTRILVPGPESRIGARIKASLKVIARDRFAELSSKYATAIDAQYSTLSIRDTKSRWGSCSTDGRLMYSWRLMMAPFSVQDYVAAHEVCHLHEMHHGPEFWALVARVYPNYQADRAWLRTHGQNLHAVDFDV